MTDNPDLFRRVGVVETTVWETQHPQPRTQVTVQRYFRDKDGQWRVNRPSLNDQSKGFPFLARLAGLWINEARIMDVPSEPAAEPGGTVH